MNWRWHYHNILNIFFFLWFGFYSAQSFRSGKVEAFVMWTLCTLFVSYWLVGDWKKDWAEAEEAESSNVE